VPRPPPFFCLRIPLPIESLISRKMVSCEFFLPGGGPPFETTKQPLEHLFCRSLTSLVLLESLPECAFTKTLTVSGLLFPLRG